MIDDIMNKIKTIVDDAYQEGYQAGFIESKTLAEYLNNRKLKDIKADILKIGLGVIRENLVFECIDKHMGETE